jgi:PAS domain S-box-containing protein
VISTGEVRPPSSTPMLVASLALLGALFLLDRLTGETTVLVGMYAAAPLLAALATSVPATAVVGALAVGLGIVSTFSEGPFDAQGAVRLTTVLLVANLAAWTAWLRERSESAAMRERFLAEAGALLAGTGADHRETLRRVARIAVPGFADWCAVDLDAEGERAAVAGSELWPSSGPSELTAPLLARSRRLGLLRFSRASKRPAFDEADTALAEELARRCALAIDDARLLSSTLEAERELRAQTERYETLLLALAEVGEGMVVLEDGRCVYANAAFERLSGYGSEELQAMDTLFDLIAEEDREEARRRASTRSDDGADAHYALALRTRGGGRVELEVAGVPLVLDDRRQLVVVVRDVTARRRAERERERLLGAERDARAEAEWARRRSDFLAEASALFDQSLDAEVTVERLARLAVRDFAEGCVVLIGSSPAQIRRVVAVARDPEREATLREVVEAYPFPRRASHPLTRTLASGRSSVLDGTEKLEAIDERHAELISELGMPSSLLVPLRARGRTHGAMAVSFRSLAPGPAADLLALFEDVALRAALAMDTSRLYEERDHVARTLQRSLLPTDLPDLPGMEVAARYLAAGAGNEVGGDFYDCFSTGGDDWALVIGDVCGKGAEAAAVTALARYTVRASVLHTRRPRSVLAELNEAILRQELHYRFCTALYASLTPREQGVGVRIATGGHPLPLILRHDGRVEMLGTPGTLLGIVAQPELSEAETLLEPGDALVLYTDGVIEASPGDDAFGPERFADFVSTLAGRDAPAIAERIEEAVLDLQSGDLRDDVAVVVVRVDPRGRGLGSASFGAQHERVAAAT